MRILLLLVLMLGMVSVGLAQDGDFEFDSSEPEIFQVLEYGYRFFEDDEWLVNAYESEDGTFAGWTSTIYGSSAAVQLYHFNSDNAPEDKSGINAFFDEEWFAGIFADYDTWEQTGSVCYSRSTAVFEFEVFNNDTDYLARYWVIPISESRMLNLFLVMPSDDVSTLDDFSEAWQPDTVECFD